MKKFLAIAAVVLFLVAINVSYAAIGDVPIGDVPIGDGGVKQKMENVACQKLKDKMSEYSKAKEDPNTPSETLLKLKGEVEELQKKSPACKDSH
jgi:hypothetical protein